MHLETELGFVLKLSASEVQKLANELGSMVCSPAVHQLYIELDKASRDIDNILDLRLKKKFKREVLDKDSW